MGYAQSNLGMVCLSQGELETAYAHMRESVDGMRSIAYPRGTAINLIRLGAASLLLGRLEEARMSLDEGLKTTEQLHDHWGFGTALDLLGQLELAEGNLEEAESSARESARLFEEDGDQLMLASSLTNLGYILSARQDPLKARTVFLKALRTSSQTTAVPAALYTLVGMAGLHAQAKEIKRAMLLASYAIQHPSSSWQTRHTAEELCSQLENQFPPMQLKSIQSMAQDVVFEKLVQEILDAAVG